MDESREIPFPVTLGLGSESQAATATAAAAAGDHDGRATFLTIVTPDRAGQARLFARSARAFHPDARFVVLLAGSTGSGSSQRMFDGLYDRVVAAEELELDGL